MHGAAPHASENGPVPRRPAAPRRSVVSVTPSSGVVIASENQCCRRRARAAAAVRWGREAAVPDGAGAAPTRARDAGAGEDGEGAGGRGCSDRGRAAPRLTREVCTRCVRTGRAAHCVAFFLPTSCLRMPGLEGGGSSRFLSLALSLTHFHEERGCPAADPKGERQHDAPASHADRPRQRGDRVEHGEEPRGLAIAHFYAGFPRADAMFTLGRR